jgi:HNH endonuclease
MEEKNTLCGCGCGEQTNLNARGLPSRFRPGHNRRLVGSTGWIECGYRDISVGGRKIAEHRAVVERRDGRKLTSAEVVHHVDGDKSNNSPENLVVVTRAEHRRLHSTTKWKRWTSEEKARARELHAGGVSIQDVSRMMGRGFSSTIRHVCNRRGRSRPLAWMS